MKEERSVCEPLNHGEWCFSCEDSLNLDRFRKSKQMLLFLVVCLFFRHSGIRNHVLHILAQDIRLLDSQNSDIAYKYVDDPSFFKS